MVTVYLTRHGKTLFNQEHRAQGWCDSPLMPAGIAVAEALGRGFAKVGVHFDEAWSGDLMRQRETARLALAAMGQGDLPVREEPGFRELCEGSFEGEREELRNALLLEKTGYPDMKALWRSGISTFVETLLPYDTTGLFERVEDVRARMDAALRKVCSQARDGSTLLVVSSSMSILCLIGAYSAELRPLPNASVCRLAWDGETFQVLSVGETSFIELGGGVPEAVE